MPRTKRDNNELFVDSDRDTCLTLEANKNTKRCQETFENLKADHRKYVSEHGKTWLRG